MAGHNPNHRFASKVSTDNELTRMVGMATLHGMQDRFAALGQVTVCICTIDGKLITEPTWGSRYSAMIGTSEIGSQSFMASLVDLANDPDLVAPSICHEGLALYAAPVINGTTRIGLVIAGTRAPQPPGDDEVSRIAAKFGIDPQRLAKTVDRGAAHTGATPEAVRQFADTMADTIATIYDQSVRIQQQLADLSIVHDLANALAGSRNLDEVLDMTVNRVVEIMGVKACGIRLLNVETGELEVRAVCNLSDEYLSKGPVMLKANAIDSQAFGGETVYIADAQSDPRIRYPKNAQREGIVSGLCVPMTWRSETIGVLRVYTSTAHEFSASECALLRSIGSQGAAAVINSRLFEQQVDTERFKRQVKSASEIQQRMLPSVLPDNKHYEFGCVYVPSLEVGGDFYDVFELPNGDVGVAVADLVGKGLPAALMMASARSVLRVSAGNLPQAPDVLSAVNRHMCRETLVSEFATMVYGVLAEDGSSFTFCNAGHFAPVRLRNGKAQQFGSSGLVVGILPNEEYSADSVDLQVGDTLVLYTDGVVEALDYDGNQFGQARLEESIIKHGDLTASEMAKQLLWDVRRFAGLAPQSDDITIVVTRRN